MMRAGPQQAAAGRVALAAPPGPAAGGAEPRFGWMCGGGALDRISAAILAALDVPALALPAVLLTTMDARRRLAELVRGVFPAVAVVSYSELAATAMIQPVSRIQLAVPIEQPVALPQLFEPG